MAAYCWDLEPSLIQLLAMMKKGSQAGRRAGQAHNTVINGARAKEMGHTDRKQRRRKQRRDQKGDDKKKKKQGKNRKERNNGRSDRNDRSGEKGRMDVTYAEDLWRNKTR